MVKKQEDKEPQTPIEAAAALVLDGGTVELLGDDTGLTAHLAPKTARPFLVLSDGTGEVRIPVERLEDITEFLETLEAEVFDRETEVEGVR